MSTDIEMGGTFPLSVFIHGSSACQKKNYVKGKSGSLLPGVLSPPLVPSSPPKTGSFPSFPESDTFISDVSFHSSSPTSSLFPVRNTRGSRTLIFARFFHAPSPSPHRLVYSISSSCRPRTSIKSSSDGAPPRRITVFYALPPFNSHLKTGLTPMPTKSS
jgi:hypothetical protein